MNAFGTLAILKSIQNNHFLTISYKSKIYSNFTSNCLKKHKTITIVYYVSNYYYYMGKYSLYKQK